MYVVRLKSGGKDQYEIDQKRLRYLRMVRRVFAWANTVWGQGVELDCYMLTLTYRGTVEAWERGQISKFVKSEKKKWGQSLLAYCWVAELQRRGVVHYHLIEIVAAGTRFWNAYIDRDEKIIRWGCGWPDRWDLGRCGVDVARSPFYVVAHSGKEYQKFGDYPKGVRMFAVWADRNVFDQASLKCAVLPKWLRDIISEDESLQGLRASRVSGGYEIECQFFPSPYTVGFSKDEQGFHPERWGIE